MTDAADTLERALGALAADLNTTQNHAERASSEAEDGTATLADVRNALEEVKTEAAVTPMDDYQQGTVCYQVGGVDYAKGSVTYHTDEARNQGSLGADKAPTVTADIAAVRAAAAELEAAVAADPAGPAPRTSPAAARGTADDAKSQLASANARAAKAVKEAAAADKTAASLLAQAQSIARSVGASC